MEVTLLDKWRLLDAIRDDGATKPFDVVVAQYLLGNTGRKDGVIRGCGRHNIAKATGLSGSSVVRSLDRLVKAGEYFKVVAEGGGVVATTYLPVYREGATDEEDTDASQTPVPTDTGGVSEGRGPCVSQKHTTPLPVYPPSEARASSGVAPVASKRSRKCPIPEGWSPDDCDRAYAHQHGITGKRVDREAEKFVTWHRGNGRPVADEHHAWRNWVLKAEDLAEKRSQSNVTWFPSNRTQQRSQIMERDAQLLFEGRAGR